MRNERVPEHWLYQQDEGSDSKTYFAEHLVTYRRLWELEARIRKLEREAFAAERHKRNDNLSKELSQVLYNSLSVVNPKTADHGAEKIIDFLESKGLLP